MYPQYQMIGTMGQPNRYMLSLQIDKKRILAPEGAEPKMVKMGIQLALAEIEEYKNLLLEFGDVFAWSYMDLKGIPLEIAQHTIPLLPNTKPIR
jgi:hypothetical protein